MVHMARWTLDDIPWQRFDPSKVDPDLLAVVRAASLVERNGGDYAIYLSNVFSDDAEFVTVARAWGEEEIQHGMALGRWARMADPDFDFDGAFARFADVIKLPLDAHLSVRGSKAGELVARCMVEIGTSSYYTALADRAEEPVLQAICRKIAADELRHYKLFYSHLDRYMRIEGLGLWGRFRVAAGRIGESEDDELAFAYHAANENGEYDHARSNRAYAQRAYALYRPEHIARGVAMVLKTLGLSAQGRLHRIASSLAWRYIHRRARRMADAA
jgi:hypothetical protein